MQGTAVEWANCVALKNRHKQNGMNSFLIAQFYECSVIAIFTECHKLSRTFIN